MPLQAGHGWLESKGERWLQTVLGRFLYFLQGRCNAWTLTSQGSPAGGPARTFAELPIIAFISFVAMPKNFLPKVVCS